MLARDKITELYQLILKSMRIVRLLVTLLSILALNNVTWAKDTQVKIGVLAKRGTERCMEQWGPTADYLTAEIPGYSFEVVPLDFGEIFPAVERGEVDFVLANPSFYVEMEYRYGANRLVTLENLRGEEAYTIFGGVIFCRADRDDIREIDDLRNKTFMAVEETSLGGWHMAWGELKEQGIDPYDDFSELQFGGTHDAVVYAVRDGTVDAGTARSDTLERMVEEGKVDVGTFRILNQQQHPGFPFALSTQVYPEWPLAQVKHTPDELAQAVTIALLRMPADSPAAKAGVCTGWTIPLNYQPVHELLMELRIGPYIDYGKVTFAELIRQYWYWFITIVVFLIFVAMATSYVLVLNRRLSQSRSDIEKELSERKMAESEREQLLTTLEHHSTRLQTAAEIGRTVTAIFDPERLTQRLVNLIHQQFGFHYAGLFLVDESGDEAILRASRGENGHATLAHEQRIKVGEGVIGRSIARAQACVAPESGEDAAQLADAELPDARAEAAIPLRSRNRVIGALTVQDGQAGAFEESTVAVLQTMADQVAVALDNARLLQTTEQTVRDLNFAVSDLLTSTTQQASGASEQSAAIAQTSTTIDEVRTIAEQTSQRAKGVAGLAQHTAQAAQAGELAVSGTVQGVQEVKSKVDTIAHEVLALSEQAQAIGGIINIVGQLAAQSNMLALNASVEAARAGEAGRGFAVVASEVRSLAQQSKVATEQVRGILIEIQHGVNAAVMATEEGIKMADGGVNLAREAGLSIQRLGDSVTESTQSAMQIAAAAGQQVTGMEQIATAMENIHQVTTQSVVSARQVEQVAGELNALASQLRELVEQYQL